MESSGQWGRGGSPWPGTEKAQLIPQEGVLRAAALSPELSSRGSQGLFLNDPDGCQGTAHWTLCLGDRPITPLPSMTVSPEQSTENLPPAPRPPLSPPISCKSQAEDQGLHLETMVGIRKGGCPGSRPQSHGCGAQVSIRTSGRAEYNLCVVWALLLPPDFLIWWCEGRPGNTHF